MSDLTPPTSSAQPSRELDLVLFGATGFTGRLVADHLAAHAGSLRWAIAGRNPEKLAALGFAGVPILVADALDPRAIAAVARRTKVVCSTVGPYARYGSALVAACAEAGTHYCDLTAEIHWMREMIDRHHVTACATGARIVHACGFDSIPSDLGTALVQAEFVRRFGRPATRVTGLFGESKGGVSGGTIASGMGMMDAGAADPAVARLFANPYALDPDPDAARPPAPDERGLGWNKALGMLTMPFIMAASNTRVVRRGHALRGFAWGDDFVYREVMSLPASPRGALMAAGFGASLVGLGLALRVPALRTLAARVLPKPGEGPSQAVRDAGYWKARFVAEDGSDRVVFVMGDRHDPGYSSTARMLGEAALCLAADPLTSPGGFLTPATAMGEHLAARLRALGFTLEPAGG